MRTILAIAVALMLVSCCALALDWDDCVGRGLIPYWINAGGFQTMLVFINEHDGTSDVIHIRFCDHNGNFCSDTTADMYSIRSREMLIFSTTPAVPRWIPTTAHYGYVQFRTEEGGLTHAYCVIYNQLTGSSGFVVPACHQYRGF